MNARTAQDWAMWQAALAARQPVGEIDEAAVLRRAAAVLHMWEDDPNLTGYMGDFKDACDILELLAQHAGPPAQAVDLGAVRALLQRRIAQWRSHLPADPGAPGTREIETKGEHDYNNDVRIYREGIAAMEEVLALTDSQAVGNG